MGSTALYCTTQVPPHILQRFHDMSTLPNFVPEEDLWALQRTPEDGLCETCLRCPVAPFVSGFENAHPEYLQWFTEQPSDYMHSSTFVILDERSLEDNTCIVYHKMCRQAPGFEHYDIGITMVDEWISWRVRFVVAWVMCIQLEHADDLVEDSLQKGRGSYIDDNGVFQMADVEQNRTELPDWDDRAPWGPGPPDRKS